MPLVTRLTDRFGLAHPVVLAPMAFAAGGRLAAAVSAAGGLGLVGGGYGNKDWVDAQLDEAGDGTVGCGFITWSLEGSPGLLDHVLERRPRAILLSFGDPRPFAQRVLDARVPLICQVQSRADAALALEAGADVVVAQGGEAGGHSERRSTFTLVPEIADLIAPGRRALYCALRAASQTGAVSRRRSLLGADGVLVGSRLWATVRGERLGAHARRCPGGDRRRHDQDERHGHRTQARLAGAASPRACFATVSPIPGTAERASSVRRARTSAGEWSGGWAEGIPTAEHLRRRGAWG